MVSIQRQGRIPKWCANSNAPPNYQKQFQSKLTFSTMFVYSGDSEISKYLQRFKKCDYFQQLQKNYDMDLL